MRLSLQGCGAFTLGVVFFPPSFSLYTFTKGGCLSYNIQVVYIHKRGGFFLVFKVIISSQGVVVCLGFQGEYTFTLGGGFSLVFKVSIYSHWVVFSLFVSR